MELRFIASVEHAVQQILEAPERWRILEEDIRRCLTRVFPYAVLYTIEKDYVLIIAEMHCHRLTSPYFQLSLIQRASGALRFD